MTTAEDHEMLIVQAVVRRPRVDYAAERRQLHHTGFRAVADGKSAETAKISLPLTDRSMYKGKEDVRLRGLQGFEVARAQNEGGGDGV